LVFYILSAALRRLWQQIALEAEAFMNATKSESESESGDASGGERRREHPSKWSSAMRAWCSSASWCQRSWYSV